MAKQKVKVPYIREEKDYWDVVVILEQEQDEPYHLLRIVKETGRVERYGSIPDSFGFKLDRLGRLTVDMKAQW